MANIVNTIERHDPLLVKKMRNRQEDAEHFWFDVDVTFKFQTVQLRRDYWQGAGGISIISTALV